MAHLHPGPTSLNLHGNAKKITTIPIMLTGGFETRDQAVKILQDGSADAISLARSMVLNPSLANTWLSEEGGDPVFPTFDSPPRGGVTAWYSMRLTALGEDKEHQFELSPASALETYEARDAERCERWRNRFA